MLLLPMFFPLMHQLQRMQLHSWMPRQLRADSGPGEKKIPPLPPLPRKGGRAKNICTKPEKLTVSCRETVAWAERVDLYDVQVMRLPIKTKKKDAPQSGPLPDHRPPVICAGLPALSSALLEGIILCNFRKRNSVRRQHLYAAFLSEVKVFQAPLICLAAREDKNCGNGQDSPDPQFV